MVDKILLGISIALNIVLMLLVGFYAGRDSQREKEKGWRAIEAIKKNGDKGK